MVVYQRFENPDETRKTKLRKQDPDAPVNPAPPADKAEPDKAEHDEAAKIKEDEDKS
jgi:hypothetical protein